MIYVTRPYLPNKKKLNKYISKLYKTRILTNRGEFVQELERRLSERFKIKNVICVANGSLGLQVTYRALKLKNEVITSPFTYIASANTLKWERIKPIFVDVDQYNWNIDTNLIQERITKRTSAILPIHTFGNPCDLLHLKNISKKYNLNLIYDASHSFDVKYKNKSVLSYGDASVVSFQSTKVFHSIEGGAIFTNNNNLASKIREIIHFGINKKSQITEIGTNAKMNEFEALVGICVLDDFEKIKIKRKKIWNRYLKNLSGFVDFQKFDDNANNNFSYAPILFKNLKSNLMAIKNLNKNKIFPRRYFYPSLDTLDIFKQKQKCKISNNIANRILCLPLYHDLNIRDQLKIIKIIKETLKNV